MAPAVAAPLAPKREEFARQFVVDLNATQAAIRAGYSQNSAASQGERLLRNAEVQRRIGELQAKRAERVDITADMVLQRWWMIATADPRELVELRRLECDKCYPDAGRRDPNPACVHCFGEGDEVTVVKDQRNLSPAARALLAGVKQTKDGTDVRMHDQLQASQMVARHLGMFIDNVHTRNATLEDALRERHARRVAEADAAKRAAVSSDGE